MAETLHEPRESGAKEESFRPERMFKSTEGQEAVYAFHLAQRDLSKPEHVLLLARCGDPERKGSEQLVMVKDASNWPDDRLVSYVFLLDSARRIRLMQVVPNSESGDWYAQDDYLFRPDGSLHYWEHYRGSFGPDEPAKTWSASAWLPDGRRLARATLAVGEDGKPWKGVRPHLPEPAARLENLIDRHRLAEALSAAKVAFR